MVLANRAGGAVKSLVHRLWVPELHGFCFTPRSSSCRPAGGCRRQCAHREAGEGRSSGQPQLLRFCRLFRLLVLWADTVRNQVGFLVPFDQKPPRHVGGWTES